MKVAASPVAVQKNGFAITRRALVSIIVLWAGAGRFVMSNVSGASGDRIVGSSAIVPEVTAIRRRASARAKQVRI